MTPLTALFFSVSSYFFLMTAGQLLQPNGDCNNQGNICEYKWKVEHRNTMVTYNETTGSGLPIFRYGNSFYKRNRDPEPTSCKKKDPLTDLEKDKVITADGTYRSAVVINGELPGPPIIVNNGTQVVVHVTNHLTMEGITIHWHGMVQRNTPWMDGVASVSHCPINPGETFTYRFLATPPGTHWYHSHLGTQRTDGLYGALIVLQPEETVKVKRPKRETVDPDFAGEFIMTLHDWMKDPSLDINNQVLWEMQRFYPGYNVTSPCFYQTKQLDGTGIGVSPFWSGLINGKGLIYRYDPIGNEVVENELIRWKYSPSNVHSHTVFVSSMRL
ncbi:uncharacterized protein [Ptychodera flava]|uniref:uncharacterized protein n=1 Tax=Ptychodera flava TaxID=63121 RepID=UPI00396A3D8B